MLIINKFQVISQENWNLVLYQGMANVSAWSSLYFIVLMIAGNYILFNLLIAIIVDAYIETVFLILLIPKKLFQSGLKICHKESLKNYVYLRKLM